MKNWLDQSLWYCCTRWVKDFQEWFDQLLRTEASAEASNGTGEILWRKTVEQTRMLIDGERWEWSTDQLSIDLGEGIKRESFDTIRLIRSYRTVSDRSEKTADNHLPRLVGTASMHERERSLVRSVHLFSNIGTETNGESIQRCSPPFINELERHLFDEYPRRRGRLNPTTSSSFLRNGHQRRKIDWWKISLSTANCKRWSDDERSRTIVGNAHHLSQSKWKPLELDSRDDGERSEWVTSIRNHLK